MNMPKTIQTFDTEYAMFLHIVPNPFLYTGPRATGNPLSGLVQFVCTQHVKKKQICGGGNKHHVAPPSTMETKVRTEIFHSA